MGEKSQYDRTNALLHAIAATGAKGCCTMFPTAESDEWVAKEAQEAWTTARLSSGLVKDSIPLEPEAYGMYKVSVAPATAPVSMHLVYS